ncbi:hypothetical protein [Desulfosporosinus sp. Sb-LF]|uniref:hypothetical protein n=1 Tax=Desulfosporosinus sp. Sb-LF TaxID=2560027 RepID=UPI00107F935B|nr:hypothetical protein [Desulfosporosinus sp. Sb-LF]TGE31438.1 hypothetical protein E4K68_17050 [Desulfosporosinus sp. Sb-LF]
MNEYNNNWYEFTTRTPEGENHRLRFKHHMQILDSVREELESLDIGQELMFTSYHGLKAFLDCPLNNALENSALFLTSLGIKNLMVNATLRQFMQVFPTKFWDCYPSLAKIDLMDLDEPLGDEIDLFMLDYPNEDIQRFNEISAKVREDFYRTHSNKSHEIETL